MQWKGEERAAVKFPHTPKGYTLRITELSRYDAAAELRGVVLRRVARHDAACHVARGYRSWWANYQEEAMEGKWRRERGGRELLMRRCQVKQIIQ